MFATSSWLVVERRLYFGIPSFYIGLPACGKFVIVKGCNYSSRGENFWIPPPYLRGFLTSTDYWVVCASFSFYCF